MNQPDPRVKHIASLALEGASKQLRERLDADKWPSHNTERWLHELVREVPPTYPDRRGRPPATLLEVSKAWTRVAAIALRAATETALDVDIEAVTNAAAPAPDEVPF